MAGTSDRMDPTWALLFGAWLTVTVASLGSLFFSEVMHLPPCSLCWYQRVFMFPLVFVLTAGLLNSDAGAARYALPLAVGGWLVGLWHVLLYTGILPESAAPCSQGVSCSTPTWALFGVLAIPHLSLLAFTFVTGLLLALRKRS